MSLRLPSSAWERVFRHAMGAYPEESCGALLGPVPPDFGKPGRAVTALEVRELPNAWEKPGRSNRYAVDGDLLARLERELAGTGRGVVGFYHSHPDVPAWPSPFDLARAWPCYSYLIVAAAQGAPPEGRSWVRSPDGRSFEEEPLILEVPA